MRQVRQPREFEPLLKAGRPNVYHTNALRLLGLATDAPSIEVNRRFQKLEMMQKLGITEPPSESPRGHSPIPLTLPLLQDARQRMNDPRTRIIEEFFWFWPETPGNSSNDDALAALGRGLADSAAELWAQRSHQAADTCAVHNLAVLSHLRALDAVSASNGEPVSFESDGIQAWEYWTALGQQQCFWARLADRISEYDDPRIGPDTAADIRAALIPTLLQIDISLATTAAEAGDFPRAARHLEVAQHSGCSLDVIRAHTERALEHVGTRVSHLCAHARTAATDDVDNTPAILDTLLADASPILKVLTQMLGPGSRLRDGGFNDVASTVRDALVRFANKTEDWTACERLLLRAQPMASGEALKLQIAEDLGTVRKHLAAKRVWGELKPIEHVPSLSTINGIGFALYGKTDEDPETQSHVATYYFTLIFVPVFPIRRYRVIPTGNGYRFLGTLPLRTFDKWHLATAVALILLLLIVAGNSNSDSSSSTSYTSYPSRSQPSATSPSSPSSGAATDGAATRPPRTQGRTPRGFGSGQETATRSIDSSTSDLAVGRASALKRQIEAAKTRLAMLASTYEQCQRTLAFYNGEISTHKRRIDEIESAIRLGLRSDTGDYQRLLNRHNSNVVLYNSTLSSCQATAAEHAALVESANAKVVEYNRLIGAR